MPNETNRQPITPHNPLEGNRPELTINLHDGTDEQISIIVVHKDRPEYLNICLQTICVNSTANNYEIIVVDNGSGQDSQDYLDELGPDVKVIKCPKNLYYSAAANKGAAAASPNSKYLIFLHADVAILNPAWLDLLINVAEGSNSGMVGVELQSYLLQNQKVDFIQEWCLLLTRECWMDAGPFPEELPQIGHSFILTINAQNKGYKPQLMKNNICHHYRVFGLDMNEWEKITEQAMTTIPKVMQQSRPL